MAPDLHPDLATSAPLLGAWEGHGHGDYPTIDAFDYWERVEFGHVGKPFLAYTQKTRLSVGGELGRPLHAEMGYLRAVGPDSQVELVVTQPTGISEVHAGRWADGSLELTMLSVSGTPTAVEVAAVRREFTLAGDVLSYRFFMATGGHPLQLHLEAELHRVS
ncbi:FABP family protein [Euzebya tangerina]|uniref:FABP family protein n=1 Tax=Euzebya tangerina TaxID=591198 RepID=UPI000E319D1A|nr:FABP family protein [Euzebya tangerina]